MRLSEGDAGEWYAISLVVWAHLAGITIMDTVPCKVAGGKGTALASVGRAVNVN